MLMFQVLCGYDDPRLNFFSFVSQERDHYSQFVSEAFDSYVSRKEKDGVHGNNPEMQAASELFNRPIEVYVPEKGSELGWLSIILDGFIESRNLRCTTERMEMRLEASDGLTLSGCINLY